MGGVISWLRKNLKTSHRAKEKHQGVSEKILAALPAFDLAHALPADLQICTDGIYSDRI